MKNNSVFCSVASNDYLPYLEGLLASARIHCRDNLFYIILVNVDTIKVEYLKQLYENIIIETEFINFLDIQSLKAYCANRRTSLFPYLMEKYNKPIIWIDADSLFLQSTDELIDYSSINDLSVEYNKNHITLSLSEKKLQKYSSGPLGTPFYGVLSTGITMTNNSNNAKSFFIDYKNKAEPVLYKWYGDQEALFLTLKNYGENIKFQPLPEKYCSRFLNQDTVIWTMKGVTRNSDQYYLKRQDYIKKVRKWSMIDLKISISKEPIYKNNNKIKIYINKIRNKIGRIIIGSNKD